MKNMKIEERDPNVIYFDEPSLTHQHFKDQCDINIIVKKYPNTLLDPSLLERKAKGVYGDFSNVRSYRDAMDQVLVARQSFNELDAKIRKRFDNDPSKLLAFVSDPANRDEGIALGILPPKEVPSQVSAQPEKGDK